MQKEIIATNNFLSNEGYAFHAEHMVRNTMVNKYRNQKEDSINEVVKIAVDYNTVSKLEEQLIKENSDLLPVMSDAKALFRHFDKIKYNPNVLWKVNDVIKMEFN